MLKHDLENTPLRIKTDTDTDYNEEKIWVTLFDSNNAVMGEIIIYLRKNPLYHIINCMSSYENIAAPPAFPVR